MPWSTEVRPGSSSFVSTSTMRELPRVNHRQRALRATIDAQSATDADVLVEEQHRLLFSAEPDVVGARNRDAVRRTHIDTETAENAQFRREHDVVETAQAAESFEARLVFVVAGLDLTEADP